MQRCIEISEKVCWTISDLLPDDFNINYEKHFLPPTLTQENELTFLSPSEKKSLNQIWGASYFNLFAFVEEYITLYSLSLANDSSFKNSYELRAFVRFSEEEVKHQQLFRCYLDKFNDSFGESCEFIGNEKDVASMILSNSKLCVLLLTYHLELITQQHYTESIKSYEKLDEKFTEILKCHWLEEAQHAKLDLYKMKEVAGLGSEEDFLFSLDEYFMVLDGFVGLLKLQAEMNFESLKKCSADKEKFNDDSNRDVFINSQHKSYVDAFIGLGLTNSKFLKEVEELSEKSIEIIDRKKREIDSLFLASSSGNR